MFDLVWGAIFKDNSILQQYSISDELETKFQEVLDRKDDLKLFYLLNRFTQMFYVVDLEKGCIYSVNNGSEMLELREDMLSKPKLNCRLIYFREVERTFDSALIETAEPKVLFFLGFQYTDLDGFNHKQVMKINSDGRFVIHQ
jgi:hypothetical protein